MLPLGSQYRTNSSSIPKISPVFTLLHPLSLAILIMLPDKGIISRTPSKADDLKGRLPQKHSRTSSNDTSIYLEDKPTNFKSTFATLLKSVTGYFKVSAVNTNKRVRISGPSNFLHFGHAGIDPQSGEFNSYVDTYNGHFPGENIDTIMCIPTQETDKSSFSGSNIQPTRRMKNLEVKRDYISGPLDPIHITHVSISNAGEYIGLPKDWQVTFKESSLRY